VDLSRLLLLARVHLLERGAPPLLDFRRGQVFLVCPHRLPMAEGIDDLGVAVSPKLIHYRHNDLGAGRNGLVE